MKGIIKKKRKRKTLMFQRKSELCVAVRKSPWFEREKTTMGELPGTPSSFALPLANRI